MTKFFWDNVDRGSEEECWLWQRKDKKCYSYVRLTIDDLERRIGIHKLSYLLHIGPTEDHFILHYCHNKSCVNPYHLHSGFYYDNGLDEKYSKKQAKLTEREVLLCQYMKLIGYSLREISKMINTSLYTVRDAALGLNAYKPLPFRQNAQTNVKLRL